MTTAGSIGVPGANAALDTVLVNTEAGDGLQREGVFIGDPADGSLRAGVTADKGLQVSVIGPRLPFGSVHTESLKPIFQTDGVYGINSFTMVTSTGLAVGTGASSGSVTSSGNLLTCATGTTQFSFASLQSRRRLRYRPGQGVVVRFTGLFSTPAANAYQVIGCGTAETTLAFGYNGTSFGILYSTGGVREVHTLTITTASTATNDYVVTLPNTATVNIAATNNGSTVKTAYEISQGVSRAGRRSSADRRSYFSRTRRATSRDRSRLPRPAPALRPQGPTRRRRQALPQRTPGLHRRTGTATHSMGPGLRVSRSIRRRATSTRSGSSTSVSGLSSSRSRRRTQRRTARNSSRSTRSSIRTRRRG